MRRYSLILLSVLIACMTAYSCKSEKKERPNPFFEAWTTPYGVPPFDRIAAEHYLPAFERAMAVQEAEIDAIVSDRDEPGFRNVIEAYDASGQMLSDVSNVFFMVASAQLDDDLAAVREQVMPLLAAHRDKILLNEELFDKIRSVYDRRGSLELDPVQMRLLEKTYRRFVRAGALLDSDGKERLREINEELSRLGVRFADNLLAENRGFTLELSAGELDGLPSGVRDAAREKASEAGHKDKYFFTLDKPSLIPFLTYSKRRDLRQELYKAYLSRGDNGNEHDNNDVINAMIRLRTEKANLLGYDSYAAYVTADQMAGTPEAVYRLLDEVWEPALDRAREELKQMDELLQKDEPGAEFASWDWWYYAEKVRKQNYALDEEMLRPYFSLENVRGGIFFLANRLYGITFRPIVVPLYNPECEAYEVLDADETHLGVLYFDFFPRQGKGGGAWCGYFREQRYRDGEREAPVVGIVANFTRPTATAPALLSLDETETLFHEFGHALHFLFHDVKYRGLSEVEGDFVELPSQIMENWATEPQVLAEYAVHYRTKEVIPEQLVRKIRNSALFNQGFATTELVAAALSDMDIHSIRHYEPFSPEAFEDNALRLQRGLIPQIEPRYRYPYFSHIFDGDYSAGYYFYLWAEVLDKDAFEAFRQSGDLFNRRIARDFRYKLLARGGEADGMTLYRDFRGADPDKTPLLRSRGLWTEPEPQPEADSLRRATDPVERSADVRPVVRFRNGPDGVKTTRPRHNK